MLEWMARRRIHNNELAGLLDMPTTSYDRRSSTAEDFPTFEEIERLAHTFQLCPKALQIAFGLRGREELCLLDPDGMRQFIEQGGGEIPFFNLPSRVTTVRTAEETRVNKRRRTRRADAPAGP